MQEDRTMSTEQGPVLTCQKTDCSYNMDECCYAGGIQVGDNHPQCDTYTRQQVQATQEMAVVSQCMVDQCHFNNAQTCHAAGITVAEHTGHADCYTMRPQM